MKGHEFTRGDHHRKTTAIPVRENLWTVLHFAMLSAVVALSLGGCRNGKSPENPPAHEQPAASDDAAKGARPKIDAPPAPVVIDVEEPDRWVRAEEIVGETEGGWVTGAFDEKRNRIDIQTENVRQFVIDTARIPINWERLVVISIDGSNAELKRRNITELHFRREVGGRWLVLEP